MQVHECCNPDVVWCNRDAAIQDVAALMRKHHVGSVVVTDAEDRKKPIGILTDRDIVMDVMATGLDARAITAGDVMSTPVVTVRDKDGLAETLGLMRTHKIRRIPVVTDGGALLGIVAVDDVVNLLAKELQSLSGAIIGQQMLEEHVRR